MNYLRNPPGPSSLSPCDAELRDGSLLSVELSAAPLLDYAHGDAVTVLPAFVLHSLVKLEGAGYDGCLGMTALSHLFATRAEAETQRREVQLEIGRPVAVHELELCFRHDDPAAMEALEQFLRQRDSEAET